MSKIVRGCLKYTGWENAPWKLITSDGEEIDIKPLVEKLFLNLHGKMAEVYYDYKSADTVNFFFYYVLRAVDKSEFKFSYEPENGVYCAYINRRLKNIDFKSFGIERKECISLCASGFLRETLMSLSGEKVTFIISDEELRLFLDR